MFLTRNPELKITLTQAQEEAREHDHREIGPDHLLVAMLTNVRGTTFRVLTEHGLSYDSARERLVNFHEQQPDSTPGADLDRDREALKSIGVDLDTVRDTIKSHLGVDITDAWSHGEQDRGRGRGRRGHRGHRSDVHGGHGMHGGGRRGPRSRRGRRAPFSASLESATDQLSADLREKLEAVGRSGAEDVLTQLPFHVLAAILRTDDPALTAVLGEVDRDTLLRDVDAKLTVPA